MQINRIAPAILIALAFLGLSSCSSQETADAIYHGGPILTMVAEGARVEAIAVADGKILAAGGEDEVMVFQGSDTRTVDLAGRCLMPGFIDPHSHVALQSAKFKTVNLDPYPIGDIKNIADIQRKLAARLAEQKLEPGKWLFGWGYDDTGLEEMRHPTREDLDAVSTEHPIFLMHISSHLATCNSAALAAVGIDADTEDPAGGRFQRLPGSREPNGVLEETAMAAVVARAPAPTIQQSLDMLEEGLRYYAAAGITTACDGASTAGLMNLFKSLDQQGHLPIDVVCYPMHKAMTDSLLQEIVAGLEGRGRFRPGGMKIIIDGSIQGYTAYLTEPYFKEAGDASTASSACAGGAADDLFLYHGGEGLSGHEASAPEGHEGNRGYASMTQEDIESWVRKCADLNIPIHAHCNGDAAIDMLLEALDKVYGDRPRPDLRNVIIHSQTIRDDQLEAAVRHGLTPSYFPIHVLFWGDRHRDLFLGTARAERLDPARSTLDRGLKITLHHDAPVAGIEMMNVVSSAVNRRTTGGDILGPDERITPYEALRAITKDAAWQYFEEDRKGTLEVGKLADMVILAADPLSVPPETLADIRILETIKEGRTVFQAD